MNAIQLRDAIVKAIDSIGVPEDYTCVDFSFTKYSLAQNVTVRFNRGENPSSSYSFTFGLIGEVKVWDEVTNDFTELGTEKALESIKEEFQKLGGIFDANNI